MQLKKEIIFRHCVSQFWVKQAFPHLLPHHSSHSCEGDQGKQEVRAGQLSSWLGLQGSDHPSKSRWAFIQKGCCRWVWTLPQRLAGSKTMPGNCPKLQFPKDPFSLFRRPPRKCKYFWDAKPISQHFSYQPQHLCYQQTPWLKLFDNFLSVCGKETLLCPL